MCKPTNEHRKCQVMLGAVKTIQVRREDRECLRGGCCVFRVVREGFWRRGHLGRDLQEVREQAISGGRSRDN